jgi:hypothetical protein
VLLASHAHTGTVLASLVGADVGPDDNALRLTRNDARPGTRAERRGRSCRSFTMNTIQDILLVEDSQNDIDLALYALREDRLAKPQAVQH